MRDFRLRTDLVRSVIDGFAMPLGIESLDLRAPTQGFTVTYTAGQDEEPDTYTFHVVASHERLVGVIGHAFELLPQRVFPIVEIGSRDAYRSTDVFIAPEPISLDAFRETWQRYEGLLLEDGSMAAGANSDEPFIEVFVDQWKGISIHAPLSMRDDVEQILRESGLDEVSQTWPENGEEIVQPPRVRPVLDLEDEYSPDLDELLLNLRHEWRLELNVDPETNLDESGRALGLTLWHAVVIVEPTDGDPERGAYVSVWATAGSLSAMEELIEEQLSSDARWSFSEIYTIDRVAFDERPEELADLPTKRGKPEVHLVHFEPWSPPAGDRDESE